MELEHAERVLEYQKKLAREAEENSFWKSLLYRPQGYRTNKWWLCPICGSQVAPRERHKHG